MRVLPETLGQRIDRLRTLNGLSQGALARTSGVSPATISRIQSGETTNPSTEHLEALARVLHVSTDYLLTGIEPLPREAYPEDMRPLFDDLALLRATHPEAAATTEAVIRTMIDQARRRADRERPRSRGLDQVS